MKIAILSDYDPLSGKGGAEISTQILAEGLSKKGEDVHLFTRPTSNLKTEEVVNEVYVNRNLKSLERFDFAGGGISSVLLSSKLLEMELVKAIKNKNFDIIHSNGRNTAIGAIWASKKLGIPAILHIRNYWPICQAGTLLTCHESFRNVPSPPCIWCHYKMLPMLYGKKGLWQLPWAIHAYLQTKLRNKWAKKASFYIAISNFVKFVLEENGFDKNKISVIPNPIEFYDSTREPQNQQHKKKILFVGTLGFHKGIYELLKAIEIIKKEIKNINLEIIGDGALKKEIYNYIQSKNIDYVHLTGNIPHKMVFEAFRNADVTVVPSIWPEPFGRVVVESMSVGTPVVACGVGGISDIIDDGKNGLLVPPKDSEALADAIIKIIKNTNLRNNLINKGKEKVKDYDIDKITDMVLDVYKKVLLNLRGDI